MKSYFVISKSIDLGFKPYQFIIKNYLNIYGEHDERVQSWVDSIKSCTKFSSYELAQSTLEEIVESEDSYQIEKFFKVEQQDTSKKDGPQNYVIPRQECLSCQECSFYSHNLVKSGPNPIYREDCKHPDIPTPMKASVFSMTGNLRRNSRSVVETPEWCPFLKE